MIKFFIDANENENSEICLIFDGIISFLINQLTKIIESNSFEFIKINSPMLIKSSLLLIISCDNCFVFSNYPSSNSKTLCGNLFLSTDKLAIHESLKIYKFYSIYIFIFID